MTTAGTVGVTIQAEGLAQFQATMQAMAASVQAATTRIEAATASIGTAFERDVGDQVERAERRTVRAIDNMGARLRTFSRSMMHAGMMGSFAAGFGGFMVGQALYNSIGTFEEQMAILGVVSGETGRQLELTAQQAEQLGASSALSATQVAQIQVELGKLGMSLSMVREMTPAVTDFAIASDMAAERAAEFAGALTNTFGIAAQDMGHAMDVVTTAANISAADVDEMAYTFRYAGSAARAAGWSLQETAAAAALMSNAGLDASVAGTALRSILTDIVAPTRMAREQMRAYGLDLRNADGSVRSLQEVLEEVSDLPVDAIARIFDMNSSTAILAMRELSYMLPDLYEGLQNVDGATQRLADARMSGLTGAFRELAGAFESLLIAMGQGGLSQMLQDFAGSLSTLASNLSKTSADTLMLVAAIAGIAIALGPVMLAVGGLIALLTSPVGLAASLVAAGIGAAIFNQIAAEVRGTQTAMEATREPMERIVELTARLSTETGEAADNTRRLVRERLRLLETQVAEARAARNAIQREQNESLGGRVGSQISGFVMSPFMDTREERLTQAEAHLRTLEEQLQTARAAFVDANHDALANSQGDGPAQEAAARAAAQAAAANAQMRPAIDPYALMGGGSPAQQARQQVADLNALAEAARNGAKAFEELRVAQGLRPNGTGEVSPAMMEQARAVIAAQNALAVAQNGSRGMLQGRRDPVGELQKEIDRSIQRTTEMIAATGGGSRSLERARIAAELMDKTRGLSAAAADEMATAIEAVNHRFAEAQERMGRMKAAFKSIGDSVAGAFENAILEGRKLSYFMRSLARDIAAIVLRNMVTAPLGNAITAALGGMFGGGKAAGGLVSPNRMYMVGEKGPELFMPATPGRILSHGALAGGAGGAVVQLNYAPVIDARGADAAAVARLEAGQTAIVAQFEPMVHRAVQNLRARRKL
jgi:TP901 family phage tail tape measure protein